MSSTIFRPIERFRHDPLQSPDRQIRLLSILPSPEGAIGQYTLQTHILNDAKCPYFIALSYEWGPDEPTSDIAINGNLFKIRSNLKEFLGLVRSAHEDFIRPLWIDAICIDQNNTAERNAQVKIMGQIFQFANLVMTWLGKQDFDDTRLVETATSLRNWRNQREYRRLMNPERFDELAPGSGPGTPLLLGTAQDYVEMWTCIRRLSEQSFWTRCWIVQEQIKAQSLLLLWGYQQIDWDTLAVAFRTIHAHLSTQSSDFVLQVAPWTPILKSIPYKVWLHARSQTDHPLLELMETYRSSNCSLPRDKAYALIGISSDSENLQVDYDKSLPDLYVNLMQLMEEKENCLKYSHLVLESLELDPLVLSRDSTLKGHCISCRACCTGKVLAIKRVRTSDTSAMFESDILEMLVRSEAIVLPEKLEQIAKWAQLAHEAFHRRQSTGTSLTFFFLSGGRIGVSRDSIMNDDSIYSLPGIISGPEHIYVRAESSQESSADNAGIHTSPTSPSLSSPPSTSFSDKSLSPIARVWLMDALIPENTAEKTTVAIPLSELVALDSCLGLELEAAPPSPTLQHRRTSRVPSVTTHHGAHSDPVKSVIDEAMRSPKMKHAERASTWPIDALAREMREKMILDASSPLNSPE